MEENKKDSFWDSTDDDFWSKPVITDDWLKNASSTRETKNPYLQEKETTYQQVKPKEEKKIKEDKSWYDNPYEQPTRLNGQVITKPKTNIGSSTSRVSNTNRVSGIAADKPKQRVHIHTIICLSFIALAVCSIIAAVSVYSIAKNKAIKMTGEISYTETACDSNSFLFDEYNSVEISDAAAIISEENFTGFPAGQCLIAIPMQVLSEQYISGAYVMKDLYIGYELDGRCYYQDLPREDTVYPYVSAYGITREEILDNYGLGNGTDDIGYLFFFVPEEVDGITLYMPKTETKNGIRMITEVLYLEMPVIHPPLGEEADDETGY